METQRRQQQAEKKEDRRLLQFAVLFPNVLLHSRTKHEKHDVLLKTHTDMVAFCKYTTSPFFWFFFVFHLPYFLVASGVSSVTPPAPGAVRCLTLLSPRLLFSRSILFFSSLPRRTDGGTISQLFYIFLLSLPQLSSPASHLLK